MEISNVNICITVVLRVCIRENHERSFWHLFKCESKWKRIKSIKFWLNRSTTLFSDCISDAFAIDCPVLVYIIVSDKRWMILHNICFYFLSCFVFRKQRMRKKCSLPNIFFYPFSRISILHCTRETLWSQLWPETTTRTRMLKRRNRMSDCEIWRGEKYCEQRECRSSLLRSSTINIFFMTRRFIVHYI